MADENDLDVKKEEASSTSNKATANDVKEKAPSPSEEQDVKPSSLGDVVKDVLGKYKDQKEEDKTASSPEKKDEEKSGLESKQDEKEASKEEVKEEASTEEAKEVEGEKKHETAVPYERFEEVNRKVKEYEEPATRMRTIEEFCAKHSITPEGFQTALDFMAVVSTDPKKARQMLSPIIEQLDVLTGEGLPADLRQEVEDGSISPARAKELAQLRLKSQGLEQTTKKTSEQVQQERHSTLVRALNTWDASKQQLHPEFKPKKNGAPDGIYEQFQKNFSYSWDRTAVKSPEDAIALAEKVLSETLGFVKQFQPAPKAQKVLKSTGSSSTAEQQVDTSKPGWARKVASQVVSRY